MAFPTTGVLDAFTRADAANPGTNWTYSPFGEDPPRVASNAITASDTGGFAAALWNPGSFGPPMETYIDLVTLPTGWGCGLYSRITDATFAEGMWVDIAAGSASCDRAGSVALAGTTSATPAWVAGDKAGIVSDTGTLKVYRYTAGAWNPTPIISCTYTGGASTGLIGFYIAGTGTVLDNFGGGTVVTATGAPALFPPASRRATRGLILA